MKIGEALDLCREQRKSLLEQKKMLTERRDNLKKLNGVCEEDLLVEEAASLELSINKIDDKFEQNQKVIDKLMDRYTAVWNMEAARQQNDAAKKYGEDLAKIMEVARRIANGDHVPITDEKKLMEYSKKMYLAAKEAATLKANKKKEKYDSLWDDEDEEKKEYDPKGKAENAEAGFDIPRISASDTADTAEEIYV